MKKSITPEQELTICNLVSSKGLSVAEAKKQVLSKPEASVESGSDDQKPKKLSAAEKKTALVPEFEALGVETPPEGDSLAKWEQALAAAKEAVKTQTEGGDTEGGDAEGGDTEGGDAEGGDAEGGDAEGGELM